MKKFKLIYRYFSFYEKMLWMISILVIIVTFLLFDRVNYLNLIASLIGVNSLIFCAKGNPFGQILMIIFSLLYGYISYTFHYYGEMITYLGMTMPMSVISLIIWLKNPFQGKKSEVKVNKLKVKDHYFMWILTILVTIIFYFILDYFSTKNIIFSTISITTSFLAVYLTSKRSAYYALAYSLNDLVLIVLWILATLENFSYISITCCFVIFFFNDLYGYYSWKRMEKEQNFLKSFDD